MKFSEDSVRSGTVRSLAAALVLLSAAAASSQSRPVERVFAVPYTGAAGVEVSSVRLTVPFVGIGEPWSSFSKRPGRSQEEIALQELLTAVYQGDTTAAKTRIAPPPASASGKAFDDYVAAFKASLQSAGALQVEGYFPLPGRVRFALRPANGGAYRVFTFRQSEGRARFDETQAPNMTDSLLNTVLRVAATQSLEQTAPPASDGVTIVIEPNRTYGDVKLTVRARLIDTDAGLLANVDPALQFYKACLSLPTRNLMSEYFACFLPDVQSRLRQEFAKMPPAEQQRVAGTMTSSRHIEFVVENPASEVVYFHSTVSAVRGRDWIEKLPNGSFAMLSPTTFFPLDDALSKPEVRDAILAALRVRR
jgi:hypothetical protein